MQFVDAVHPGDGSRHHVADPHRRTRWTRVAAVGLFGLAVAELVTAVIGVVVAQLSFREAAGSYLVTNLVIGTSCAVSGILLTWHRPRNQVGWWLAVAGVSQNLTAAAAPFLVAAPASGRPTGWDRTLATIFSYSWPWSIGLCLPMALLLFPTGTLPSPRWRWVAAAAVVAGLAFVVQTGSDSGGVDGTGRLTPWWVIEQRGALVWQLADFAPLLVDLVALVALIIRYRRADERGRRQLLWLALSLLIMLAVLGFWGPLVPGLGVLNLLAIALVPLSMTVAVLRYQLLDIRLAVSRTLVYGLLTVAVVLGYLGLVAVADATLRSDASRGTPAALFTLLIALAFNPVRVWLQRLVDRAVYGDRSDPVRAVARLGRRLATGDQADLLQAVIDALRLPYAALRIGGSERASGGAPTTRLETVPLQYRGEQVGELVVGLHPGQVTLPRPDRAVLDLLAAPIAVAAHATTLAEDVRRSRERVVSTRTEERQRLRRDLHDGLGPALTGMAFQVDAARNMLRTDPDRSEDLLRTLRSELTEALDAVRRLVDALRSPALDELGLRGALTIRVEQLNAGPVAVEMDFTAPETLTLPPAVEVAAYRVAVEALTNAVRHSGGTAVRLSVAAEGDVVITVEDDGDCGGLGWRPGTGLTSMHERVAQVGGSLAVGPSTAGGRVVAHLPLTEPSPQHAPVDPVGPGDRGGPGELGDDSAAAADRGDAASRSMLYPEPSR